MRVFISILLPWLQFFLMLRPLSGLVSLFLQLTLVGWPFASLWAVYAYREYRIERTVRQQMGLR